MRSSEPPSKASLAASSKRGLKSELADRLEADERKGKERTRGEEDRRMCRIERERRIRTTAPATHSCGAEEERRRKDGCLCISSRSREASLCPTKQLKINCTIVIYLQI